MQTECVSGRTLWCASDCCSNKGHTPSSSNVPTQAVFAEGVKCELIIFLKLKKRFKASCTRPAPMHNQSSCFVHEAFISGVVWGWFYVEVTENNKRWSWGEFLGPYLRAVHWYCTWLLQVRPGLQCCTFVTPNELLNSIYMGTPKVTYNSFYSGHAKSAYPVYPEPLH